MSKSVEFTAYGRKVNISDPIIASAPIKDAGIRVGDVIWDGKPVDVVLGRFSDKKQADYHIEEVKKNVKKNTWKFWVS